MAYGQLNYTLSTSNTHGVQQQDSQTVRWTLGISGSAGKRETVSLTGSAFTALSPPTGARAVALFIGSTASLTLKGVTGDTGTVLTGSSTYGIPAILPISSPSIGIYNGGSTAVVEVLWL